MIRLVPTVTGAVVGAAAGYLAVEDLKHPERNTITKLWSFWTPVGALAGGVILGLVGMGPVLDEVAEGLLVGGAAQVAFYCTTYVRQRSALMPSGAYALAQGVAPDGIIYSRPPLMNYPNHVIAGVTLQ
jgi:hypothetical protein